MSSDKEILFGKIAVLLGYVTDEQIDWAVQIQEEEHGRPLGAILLSESVISDEQLAHILQVQTKNMQKPPSYSSQKKVDILFGKLAVKHKYTSQGVVNWALRQQALFEKSGIFLKLGELLIHKGYLTPAQVQEILSLQGKKILVCTNCLTQYNVAKYKPGSYVKCTSCGEVLTIPDEVVTVSVEDSIHGETAASASLTQGRPLVTPASLPAEGSTLGKYHLLEKIGEGGMGAVYKAQDSEIRRTVALKIMNNGELATEEDKKRFLREARTSGNLTHTNIVKVFDAGVADDDAQDVLRRRGLRG